MLREIRLQWHIAWSQFNAQQLVKIWFFILIVGTVSLLLNMGYATRGRHSRDYIPFEVVLKKNFLLQEQISEKNEALLQANKQVREYERMIENLRIETSENMLMVQKSMIEYQEAAELTKAKSETFEGIMEKMETEKIEHRKIRQENIQLTMDIKESKQLILDLQAKVEEYSKIVNDSKEKYEIELSQDSDRDVKVFDDHITQEEVVLQTESEVVVKSTVVAEVNNSISSKNSVEPYCSSCIDEVSLNGSSTIPSSTAQLKNNDSRCKGNTGTNSTEDEIKVSDSVIDIEFSISNVETDGVQVNDEGISSLISEASFDEDMSNIGKCCFSCDPDSEVTSYYDEDDEVVYMLVGKDSMTREYILLNEDEEESWFTKKEVTNAVREFLACDHQIHGKTNCEKRRLALSELLNKLEKGVQDENVKSNFLNDAFSRYYEITGC